MHGLLKLGGVTICFVGLTCFAQTPDKMSSLCRLREKAAQGEHMKVLVRGVLKVGPESSTLNDPACSLSPYSSTWVEFDLRSKSNEKKLKDLLNHSQRVDLTSEGEFYGPP